MYHMTDTKGREVCSQTSAIGSTHPAHRSSETYPKAESQRTRWHSGGGIRACLPTINPIRHSHVSHNRTVGGLPQTSAILIDHAAHRSSDTYAPRQNLNVRNGTTAEA